MIRISFRLVVQTGFPKKRPFSSLEKNHELLCQYYGVKGQIDEKINFNGCIYVYCNPNMGYSPRL